VEASDRWYTDDVIEPRIEISADGFLEPRTVRILPEKLERYGVRHATFE
jgi:hypothetical protein